MDTTETLRAYQFCLDPTPAQEARFRQYAGAARWAYNLRLEVRRAAHERWSAAMTAARDELGLDYAAAKRYVSTQDTDGATRTQSRFDQEKTQLTPLIAEHRARAAVDPDADDAWLHTINRRALVAGMADADAAWKNWQASVRGQRAGARMGYPRWKAKGRSRDAFKLCHDKNKPEIRLETYRRLRIPGIGEVRLHGTGKRLARAIRRGTAVVRSVTVSRSGHRWYASVLVEQETEQRGPSRRQRAAGTVGVDLGVKATAALSTGELIPNPKVKARHARRLAKLQRSIARAQKGSNRRRRLTARLGRLHHLEALERAHHTHALTKRLATRWETIAVEDLNVAGMTRSARGTRESPGRNVRAKSGLNRGILDVAFGEIRRQLEYKTSWYGSQLHVVDRWAPTSKACSACGWVRPKLSLAEREFHCDTCGLTLDRDVNAARNIAAFAAAVPAESGDVKARGGPSPDPSTGGNGEEPQKREDRPRGGHRSGAIPDPSSIA